jgi:hypothetical protein
MYKLRSIFLYPHQHYFLILAALPHKTCVLTIKIFSLCTCLIEIYHPKKVNQSFGGDFKILLQTSNKLLKSIVQKYSKEITLALPLKKNYWKFVEFRYTWLSSLRSMLRNCTSARNNMLVYLQYLLWSIFSCSDSWLNICRRKVWAAEVCFEWAN